MSSIRDEDNGKKHKSMMMSRNGSHQASKSKLLTMSPRELYPHMHQKTHFKAVYEMFVNPASG